jgi:hypothetical protein
MFNIFKRKTKEEKVFEELQKKKNQIEKIKEEMKNMAKLQIVNGKIVRTKDDVNTTQPVQNELSDEQKLAKAQQILEQQEYKKIVEAHEQEMLQQKRQELLLMQQAKQQIEQQEAMLQQQAKQIQEEQNLTIVIKLTNGDEYKLEVPANSFEDFSKDMDNSLTNNVPFNVGNITINSKHILLYMILE